MPMTGRKTGSVWHTAFVTAMAGMVWLATWPRLSPVTRPPHSYWMASFSAMRIMKRRMIRVRELLVTLVADLLLDLGERHDQDGHAAAVGGQLPAEGKDLLLGPLGGVGIAEKVHADKLQAALCHHVARDRRVDAARQQQGRAAVGADRHAARARHRAACTKAYWSRISKWMVSSGWCMSGFMCGYFSASSPPRCWETCTEVIGKRLSPRLVSTLNERACAMRSAR